MQTQMKIVKIYHDSFSDFDIKEPLENIILLKDNTAFHVGNCFKERHSENIVRDAASGRLLQQEEVVDYRKMISRYFDVTRSQLLFSSGCLFIEGISECQLVETFSKLIKSH